MAAGACWVIWAIANTVTHGAFEHAASTARAAALLTVGWNLLLIPAAINIYQAQNRTTNVPQFLCTLAGVLSLSFWAFGGAIRITPRLETAYLTLAAVWMLGIGPSLRPLHPRFAIFTIIVGCFTALDAVFTLFEPMPFALYILAAPKLPLSAAWSVCLGITLVSGGWTSSRS